MLLLKRRRARMDKLMFDDESVLEVPDMWKECIKIKYGYGWKQYWVEFADLLTKLWEEGVVLTKFGKESIEGYCEDFGEKEPRTKAWHAKKCIYADLRSCIMAKILGELGGKEVSVIEIGDDKVRMYKGGKMNEYDDIKEVMEEEKDA
jgi:hypothetical protein